MTMPTSSELKSSAKQLLAGKYMRLISALLTYALLYLVLDAVLTRAFGQNAVVTNPVYLFCLLALMLLLNLVRVGYCKMILNISRGEAASLKDLFFCFHHQPDHMILLSIVPWVIVFSCFLPSLLVFYLSITLGLTILMIPVIFMVFIAIISSLLMTIFFSQATYLYLDHPEMPVASVLRESHDRMRRQYPRYFYLQISFAGMFLLGILTCLVGFLWVTPYREMTLCCFYNELPPSPSAGETDEDTFHSFHGEENIQ